MKRLLLWLAALNAVALIVLVFVYPHLMISPGALVQGHAELATDCFACHAPWRGASAERCTLCHKPADIGLRSTKGATLPQRALKASFHQKLIEQDCMACHSDHLGPKLTQRSRKPFSHALLMPEVSKACGSCHRAPEDRLHRKVGGDCGACHSQEAWKPATFEHDRHFVLDRDHDVACVTCHVGNDYARYTCYGCHEHTPANVRAEHEEEGIRDFADCVECHRDPGVEPGEGNGRSGGGRRGGGDRRERD
ncbi:cytochrome c3 family protein [Leptothrix discophora]|uniref:Cytochrome c3 family protein n=1 Tax=Leptothrix discophora TaxID=89 RepID=A0ABT9G413_LEPDI|nr:cytochrome c3 family protein [Leptothrix discophora]MDP4301197.1 cytochrome c3 family protein [Leptothrix discophora]